MNRITDVTDQQVSILPTENVQVSMIQELAQELHGFECYIICEHDNRGYRKRLGNT